MRGRRARGQLWAFAYLAVRRLLELIIVTGCSERTNEIELLALRTKLPSSDVRFIALGASQPTVRS